MWEGCWSCRIIALKRAGVHATTRKMRYHEETAYDRHGDQKIIQVQREKGADIRLVLDVVVCARRREFNVAVIHSLDLDLN